MLNLLIVLLLIISTSAYAIPNTDLCEKFVPQNNKPFEDTFKVTWVTISRPGRNKLTGTIKHKFKNNSIFTANITAATCYGNTVAFSWNQSKNFYGSFSGTLQCYNNIYNIVNVLININGQGEYIPAMASTSIPSPCPG